MALLLKPIVLALVVCVIGYQFASAQADDPVKSKEEDEVTELPGLAFKPDFKHYSGYLNADDHKNRFWHYWFVESRSNPSKDPLVLWLNGGPGCSSMLGLMTELGPFRVGQNNTVINNPFAWNKRANVIFMESPAGVGYSYAADGDVTADDDTTAAQNHQALKSFMKKFPEYKGRELYLTGESYAGVYLPTLAVLVDADNELNLKGVAIGNGYLNANKLAESLVYFSYYHGLVGRETWNGLSQYCCDNKPPARGNCNFLDKNRSHNCEIYVTMATDQIINSGINPYNLYDICNMDETEPNTSRGAKEDPKNLSNSRSIVKGREFYDKQMIMSAFNISNFARLAVQRKHALKGYSTPLKRNLIASNDPPCTDDSLAVNYLNQNTVRKALHIPNNLDKVVFSTCADINYSMIYPNMPDGLAPQMRKLIESPRKLNLLVYNGDVDLMCNFFGDEWFVDDLNRAVTSEYTSWTTRKQISGFIKKYKGINYMTIKGSGHMVPMDRPAEALHMFEMFLDGMKE